LKADYWIIKTALKLIGCVEVKKPVQSDSKSQPENPMEHPNVLGQLFNYMQLVKSNYGTTPVWGILTTFNEWRFCKLIETSSTPSTPARSINVDIVVQSPLPGFSTPTKSEITDVQIDCEDDEVENSAHPSEIPRVMEATEIYKCDDPNFLKSLARVLLDMASSENLPKQVDQEGRVLLVFFKGKTPVTFAPLTFSPKWSVFCNANSKTLYALRDLGHGRDGRLWLVCNTSGAVAVLKFVIDKDTANQEATNWYRAYSGTYAVWPKKIRAEQWSNRWAVVLPRFSYFHTKDERLGAIADLQQMMQKCFVQNELMHNDVKWRNIGYFKNGTKKEVILFDLSDVATSKDIAWVSTAIKSLETSA
jgi:hypothetical protein